MPDYEEQLSELLRQEALLQFSEFTNEIACAVGMSLVEAARADALPVTVDVCRNGQQLFHCALPGTSADNDAWIRRKNRVVNRFGHSSLYIGTQLVSKGTTIEQRSLLDPTKYAAHGGAFPVIIRNAGVVGTITVSGLPQQEDHALVVRVLAEFLGVTLGL
ncbi:MAG TPA: heme-degrading domain-containing protein [Ktedonobacterales bacterium]|nr:heme-degrading domain-containing protein [Ktedonobacterales bacterium]